MILEKPFKQGNKFFMYSKYDTPFVEIPLKKNISISAYMLDGQVPDIDSEIKRAVFKLVRRQVGPQGSNLFELDLERSKR